MRKPEFTSSHEAEIDDKLCAVVGALKRDIGIYYSELRLRLPRYLKNVTIGQIKEANGTIYTDITFPPSAKERLRKVSAINDKFNEILDIKRAQIREYYANLREQLPADLLQKRTGDLNEKERDWIISNK